MKFAIGTDLRAVLRRQSGRRMWISRSISGPAKELRSELSEQAGFMARDVPRRRLSGRPSLREVEQFGPRGRSEPVARPRGVHQPVSFVVPDDESIKVFRRGCIARDNQLLALIDSHFLPRARTLARFILAIPPFRD